MNHTHSTWEDRKQQQQQQKQRGVTSVAIKTKLLRAVKNECVFYILYKTMFLWIVKNVPVKLI